MYRVNVIFDDGIEVAHGFQTEPEAMAFIVRCEEESDIVETKLLRPSKDKL